MGSSATTRFRCMTLLQPSISVMEILRRPLSVNYVDQRKSMRTCLAMSVDPLALDYFKQHSYISTPYTLMGKLRACVVHRNCFTRLRKRLGGLPPKHCKNHSSQVSFSMTMLLPLSGLIDQDHYIASTSILQRSPNMSWPTVHSPG